MMNVWIHSRSYWNSNTFNVQSNVHQSKVLKEFAHGISNARRAREIDKLNELIA
jgi:hypothetical protein